MNARMAFATLAVALGLLATEGSVLFGMGVSGKLAMTLCERKDPADH